MAYFAEMAGSDRIAPSLGGAPGLRASQIGALGAIVAHFSLRSDAGLVVLPTGAGKTAVLMLSAFRLLPRRVLVISSSRFVREQIAQDFRSLATLINAGVFSKGTKGPVVVENKSRAKTVGDWEGFRVADVVVSTPNAASPAASDVAPPPSDLFDLILVDEAHHAPAPTWNSLINAFPKAKTLLFTATPFRRDRKEIRAKSLYAYPIQRAFEDGIYGDMTYIPVSPDVNGSPDEALALAAAATFEADRAAGLNHSLMVRCDSRPRARELEALYGRRTALKLALVDSSQSPRAVDKIVQQLRNGALDGVICVNMLGEGFDLPRLKIAALHAPHRSLAVTLQFFGRFARVNSEGLGEAKFLGVPSELSGELSELFEESDFWGRRIRLVGQARIGEEIAAREFLEAFENEPVIDQSSVEHDISLYSFSVFNHVKIHTVSGTVDLHKQVDIPGFTTKRRWMNDAESTLVVLLREASKPPWATTRGLERIEHHLVVVFWDDAAQLLFVCSTYREESFYKSLVSQVISGTARGLSLNRTNRVLRGFSELELFNVGIRNRASGTVAESYRQMSGSSAHRSLNKGDAALYHRGHIFGRGVTASGVSTIGISSLGKVWRLEPTRIPALIEWCKQLARQIENSAPFTTGIAIDHFDAGVDIDRVPAEVVIAADWDEEVYRRPWRLVVPLASGELRQITALELDLRPEPMPSDPRAIRLRLMHEEFSCELNIVIGPVPRAEYADDQQPRIEVVRGVSRHDLLATLTEEHFRFYLGDGSVVQGSEMFAPHEANYQPFDVASSTHVVDWASEGVDVKIEFGPCVPLMSIHDWVQRYLLGTSAEIIVYDHRSGECADFVAISADGDGHVVVQLYHCKASGGSAAGDRTADAYEVAGQAIKAAKFRNRKRLLEHLLHRLGSGSSILRGTLAGLRQLLEADPRYEITLMMHIVQPGITATGLSTKIGGILAAVNGRLIAVGCEPLNVICSK